MEQHIVKSTFQRKKVAKLSINNKIYDIYEGVNTIGRNREAVVNIKHLNVSQHHAVITTLNDSHFISDLKSSNGTYCDDKNIIPFKLHDIKHNTRIKLGDVEGFYATEGLNFNDTQTFANLTQDATQSFYGSNTQILQTSNGNVTELQDIHEATTQVIPDSEFKVPRCVKSFPDNRNHNNCETDKDDIFNMATQVVTGEVNAASTSKGPSVITNSSDVLHDLPLIQEEEDIHDVQTQVFDNDDLTDVNEGSTRNDEGEQVADNLFQDAKENTHSNNSTEILNIDSENLEATIKNIVETAAKLKETKHENDEKPEIVKADIVVNDGNDVSTQEKPKISSIIAQKDHEDDETDCEDNLAVTAVRGKPTKSNESSNDSSDFFKIASSEHSNPIAEEIASTSKKEGSVTNNIVEFKSKNDTDTDSEDGTQDIEVPPLPIEEFKDNDNSKDSIETDKGRSATSQSSGDSIYFKKKKICQIESDSDTTDVEEEIQVRRKKKSALVISTQDIHSDPSILTLKSKKKINFEHQDNYLIEETDSETEAYLDDNKMLEKSIPATQNVTTEFNDSDFIPATQEVTKPLSLKLKTSHLSQAESSEESFRLGLTQMMEDATPEIVDLGSTVSKSSTFSNTVLEKVQEKETEDNDTQMFAAATQKVSESQKPTQNDTADIYMACTQKINPVTPVRQLDTFDVYVAEAQTIPDKSGKDLETSDIYLAATQISATRQDASSNLTATRVEEELETSDIYLAATQQVPSMHLRDITKNMNAPLNAHKTPVKQVRQLDTSDVYLAETQEIPANPDKSGKDLETSDIYLAATQQISATRQDASSNLTVTQVEEELETSDIYLAATQQVPSMHLRDMTKSKNAHKTPIKQIDPSDIYLADTQKADEQLETSDIYLAATQQIPSEHLTDTQKATSDTCDLYLGPTQEINNSNLYNIPTQQMSNTQLEDTFNEPTQRVSNNLNEDAFVKPRQVASGSSNVPKKFLFKKVNCNLDGSLSTILKDNAEDEFVKNSLEVDFGELKEQEADSRPTNPVSQILEKSVKENIHDLKDLKEAKKKEIEKSCIVEDKTTENNVESAGKQTEKQEKGVKVKSATRKRKLSVESNKSTGSEADATSSQKTKRSTKKMKKEPDNFDESKNQPESIERNTKKQETDSIVNVKVEKRWSNAPASSSKSDLNKQTVEVPQRSLVEIKNKVKTRRSSTDRTRSNSPAVKPVKVKQEVISPAKPTRSSRRKLLGTDQLNDMLCVTNQIPEERNSTICNTTTSEGNQSLALLEAKTMRTRKTNTNVVDTEKLDLKVPKNRRSMAVVEQNETISVENTRKSIVEPRKRGRGKAQKDAPTEKIPSTSSRTTRKEPKKEEPSVKAANSDELTKQKPETSRGSKRKTSAKSPASENSEGSPNSGVSKPKKQKIQANEALLNSAERVARRQKPKVVFTMMDNPQVESLIRQLGGSIVDSVETCTVLVTEHVKRSQKLLCAVGLGKPICSPKWILDSKKASEFLDPWSYILKDREAETKWNFALEDSLKRSREHKLLENYHFNIQVTAAVDVLKGAIDACGGKVIAKIPSKPLQNTFVISSAENQTKYKKILKQHGDVKVIAPEAIFDGVLRQELRLSDHYLT